MSTLTYSTLESEEHWGPTAALQWLFTREGKGLRIVGRLTNVDTLGRAHAEDIVEITLDEADTQTLQDTLQPKYSPILDVVDS